MLFIIVISIFIGLNIIRVIDNKLNNVSIKMPKVVIPPANIIVKIVKENGEYKMLSAEHFTSIKKNNNKIEKFRNIKQINHIKKINDLSNLRPL